MKIKCLVEEWKYIEGFEDRYKISNTGKVFSSYCNKEMKSFATGKGYLNRENNGGYKSIILYSKVLHKGKNFKIHRLVAQHFIDNPKNLPQVNHIDGNKHNNNVDNLEWCTNSQNQIHAYKNGLSGKNPPTPPSKLYLNSCNKTCRPVVCFDVGYKYLNLYPSIDNCHREKGGNISKCCTYYSFNSKGYKFRYLKECILKDKIILISGKTASGKNKVLEELKLRGFNQILTSTTRPKRDDNEEGYNFISEEELNKQAKNDQFIDLKEYKTIFGKWFYALPLEELLKYEKPILIIDNKGKKTLEDKIGRQNIVSIFIDTDYDIRKNRALNRKGKTEEEVKEVNRRLESDELDFLNCEKEYDYIFKNNTKEDLENIINKIININTTSDIQDQIYPIKFKKGVIEYKGSLYDRVNIFSEHLGIKHYTVNSIIKKYDNLITYKENGLRNLDKMEDIFNSKLKIKGDE
ncbi:MAG: HNH endonuclease [Clostridium sp.]|uniref:HNH endonuclease n=1 Tax=Clostridium sp. TaxID=1506 RepID=UPI003F33672E